MNKNYFLTGVYGLLLSGLLAHAATAQTTRLDPTFQLPVILNAASPGTVSDVVRQADGKYVIGGAFTSINGVRARNLARLNADGTLDAAFTANSAANRPVYSLALQPDGSIVAGGVFDTLANVFRPYIGRVLSSGALDLAFTPVVPSTDVRVNQVAIAPGGDVLSLTGSQPRYGVTPAGLRRFDGATGQPVPGFTPAVDAVHMAIQPDGKILTAGSAPAYVSTYMVARLLPNGSLDPSFAHRINAFISAVNQVGYAANGEVYMAGNWSGAQLARAELTGPQGRLGTGGLYEATGFAFQPNGRILLRGVPTAAGQPVTSRILPNGQVDGTYVAANGPVNGSVTRMLVQPDGAMMMAGSFTLAGTTPVWGLVRMLDANVLSAKNSQAEKGTTAWPVPASAVLNVGLELAARPHRVQLLDALGRVVLAQPVAATTNELALNVAALAAGAYVLRVDYEQAGPVVRRVVLE
nr:hypothetical protein [uncultured organism]